MLEGSVAEALLEHALGEGSDLVVMTTHGHGPASRCWLGSVADQLVHILPIPLLLVHTREGVPLPGGEPAVHKVLVALDGSSMAEQILQPAGSLAKLMGASCTLLRAVSAVVSYTVYTEGAVDAALADRLRAEAHHYLQRVAGSLRGQGFDVRTRVLADAHPATAILNEAAGGEYDLLALETHGRRGLPRLFLGSVADKVVRGATVPVLVHRCLPG